MKAHRFVEVEVEYRHIDRPRRGVYLVSMKHPPNTMVMTAVNVRLSVLGYRVASPADRLMMSNAI